MSELWTLAKISAIFSGLPKLFLVIHSRPRLGLRATCWNYKISQCVMLKTKRAAIIKKKKKRKKQQNKIFHSHWDKRHKFPLRIDLLAARQTLLKKTCLCWEGVRRSRRFRGQLWLKVIMFDSRPGTSVWTRDTTGHGY